MRCVCQPYGSCTTQDCASVPGRNRLAPLRIGYFPHCYQRYSGDITESAPIESNPVYLSLTYSERKEYEKFEKEVKESFPDSTEAEGGPQLSHLISDIMVGQEGANSGANCLSFSSILGLLSAIIAFLFFLV